MQTLVCLKKETTTIYCYGLPHLPRTGQVKDDDDDDRQTETTELEGARLKLDAIGFVLIVIIFKGN